MDSTAYLTSVSCPTSLFCAAVDVKGNAVTYNGDTWNTPESIDGTTQVNSVSCASSSFCVAVDLKGNALTYNGTSWSAPKSIGTTSLASVSCPSASFCAAVDDGDAVTFNGSTWSAQASIDPGAFLQSVSCASASFCAAVDDSGNALTYNGSTWSLPASIGGVGEELSVSCPASTFCVAAIGQTAVTYNGATWSEPVSIDASGRLDSVSCASASSCTAMDIDGNALTYTRAPSSSWSGEAPAGTANWSNAANWAGSTPSGTVGTLAFPALTSDACAAKPPTATCYTSNNDLSGLKVNALSIDDGAPYNITGNAITLGNGGITAAPSASDTASATRPALHLPITLSAPQKWSITGGSHNQQLGIEAPVTGGNSDTLAINFANGTFLGLYSDTEVGAVTATGHGTIALGLSSTTGSLNATDGNAVSLSGGAGLFTGTAKIGPLTMSEGQIQIGEGSDGSHPDGSLTVAGGVTLESASTLFMFIDHSGTTPATDYTQLSAIGTVNLASAHLTISDGVAFVGGKSACAQLTPGDVDTLITTTGAITGTFAGVPNGATISLSCVFGATGTLPTVKIDYTAHTVTATVETPGSGPPTTTTTTLSPSPVGPVTNQPVTLTATVTASSGTPSGAVGFDNNGTPIPGCLSQPVSSNGSSYTATCQTAFAATSSPEPLTAVFTPATGSGLASSSSAVDNLTVGKDATSTALAVSSATPAISASVTYTATVTPAHAGAAQATGSVEFLDGGTPIGACASQPLTAGASGSTATCALSYPAAGAYGITGTYLADSNFTGSSSAPAQTVTVQSKSEGGGSAPGEGSGAGATSGGGVLGFKSNVLPAREIVTLASGAVMIRRNGTSRFVPLSGSSTIPDGSEVDATNGRVVITVTTPSGKTVSAEVYGGRFRLHQDSSGVARFILTLPLTGCPRGPLPPGSAASLAKHSGPKARHLWVSETGGSWGTNGRYVSTTVQGTTWLTLDECTRSQVRVTAGKVKVLDLVRKRTKTLTAGGSYVAQLTSRGRHK
jgi:hypothetical protein